MDPPVRPPTTHITIPSSGNNSPASQSPSSTPNRSSSGILEFTPKRAMASFENLVALANHQERLKEARKMVWRDKGQPVVDLTDLRACLEHAGRGGLSEWDFSFSSVFVFSFCFE
jgi:hypothetical protein